MCMSASRAQLAQAITEAEKRAAFQAIRSRIHGRRHWLTVAEIAFELRRRLPIPFASIEVPILFAVLHNSQCTNDGVDREHGSRAAIRRSVDEGREISRLAFGGRLLAADQALVHDSDGHTTKDLAVGA